MNKKCLYLFLLSSSFLFSIHLDALLCRLSLWKMQDSNEKIDLLSENHDRSKLALLQAKDLIHFLRQTNSSLIIEDSNNTTNEYSSLYQLYKKRKEFDRSLYAKASLAHTAGVLATSVEFRTIKQIVSVQERIDDTNRALAEIDNYDDFPLLNKYYHDCTIRHREQIAPRIKAVFEDIEVNDKKKKLSTVYLPAEVYEIIDLYDPTDFMKNMSQLNKVNTVLSYYNAELLDAKLMHAIVAHQKMGKKSIVVCAGGWHIRNVETLLLEMGYRLGTNFPIYTDNPLELKSALSKLNPEYDPNAKLPKTMVDCLLDYSEFENNHPALMAIIPTGVLCVVAGAALYLAKIYISSGNGV